MAAPLFQAVGGAEKANKKAITLDWPAHQQYDVGLLFIETSQGEAVTLATPSGFVEMVGSPFSAAGAGTQLSVFWCRATSSSMPKVVTSVPSDHIYGVIASARGCAQAGTPWDAFAGAGKAIASASVSVPGVTTLDADRLVFVAITKDLDAVAAFASGQANANLSGIAEDFDAGTTLGNGGGISVMHGTKATAGAVGATSINVTSSRNAYFAIALKPPGNVTVALAGATLTIAGGQIGPFVGDALVALQGAQLQSHVGAVQISGDALVALTGASLAVTPGAVAVETGVEVALVGSQLQAQAGIVEPVIDVRVIPVGGRLTVSGAPLGTVAAGTVGLEGGQLAIAGGTVAARGDANVELQGAELGAQAGAVSVAASRDVSVALVGRELSASGGTAVASVSIVVAVSGAAIAITPGEVVAAGGSGVVSVNVDLVGASLLISRGNPQVRTPAESETQPNVHILARQSVALEIVDGLRQAASR